LLQHKARKRRFVIILQDAMLHNLPTCTAMNSDLVKEKSVDAQIYALTSLDRALVHLGQRIRSSGYRFTAVTPDTHKRVNARPKNAHATDIAGIFGWSRQFQPSVLPAELFGLMCSAEIVIPDGDRFQSVLRLSSLGEDVYFHSAYPTIDHDAVFFGPDTYRFAAAIKRHIDSGRLPVQRAADIGCGAGPGAILLARAFPQAEVVAVDINDQALRLTRVNACLAGVSNITVQHSDLLKNTLGNFDLIVANPPYLIDPTERAYRHGGGKLGHDLSLAIVDNALDRLTPGGTLLLYTGVAMVSGVDLFYAAVKKRVEEYGAACIYEELDPDVFGEELLNPAYTNTDRIAAVVLTITKK
jgi:methylase of polypeptide subunit release factors